MHVLKNWVSVEGINASGKTSYIKKYVLENPGWESFRDTYPLHFKPDLLCSENSDKVRFNHDKRLLGLDKYLFRTLSGGKKIISDRCFLSSLVYDSYSFPLCENEMQLKLEQASFFVFPSKIVLLSISYQTFLDRIRKIGLFDIIEEEMLSDSRVYYHYTYKYRKWLTFIKDKVKGVEIMYKRMDREVKK